MAARNVIFSILNLVPLVVALLPTSVAGMDFSVSALGSSPGSFRVNACANLSADVVLWATTRANGTKRGYFEALRQRTKTNLTVLTYPGPGIRLMATGKGALFIGDSITEELAGAFKVLMGGKYRSHFVSVAGGFGESGEDAADHGASAYRNAISVAVNKTGGGNYSVFFIGGFGLHHLSRVSPCIRNDPAGDHQRMIAPIMSMFAALSVEMNVPIIFVGAMGVDGTTIQLKPAKHDWISFSDFNLPLLWDGVEASTFEAIQKSSFESAAGQRATEGIFKKKAFPLFFHFRPADMSRQCPGVRCDGMHYGSAYSPETGKGNLKNIDFSCAGSAALWHRPFATFLLEHFSATPHRRVLR